MKRLVLVLLLCAGTLWAAEPLKLTEPEQKDMQILRLKQANLNLQFQALVEKFNQEPEVKKLVQANRALEQEMRKMLDALAKSHGVDLTTHQLDSEMKNLVPIPQKQEGKK